MLRIAINGFGRIGRTALRLLENTAETDLRRYRGDDLCTG